MTIASAAESNAAVAAERPAVQTGMLEFQALHIAVIVVQMGGENALAFRFQKAHVVERGSLAGIVFSALFVVFAVLALAGSQDGDQRGGTGDARTDCQGLVAALLLVVAVAASGIDVPVHHFAILDTAVEAVLATIAVIDQSADVVGSVTRFVAADVVRIRIDRTPVHHLAQAVAAGTEVVVGKGGRCGEKGGKGKDESAFVAARHAQGS